MFAAASTNTSYRTLRKKQECRLANASLCQTPLLLLTINLSYVVHRYWAENIRIFMWRLNKCMFLRLGYYVLQYVCKGGKIIIAWWAICTSLLFCLLPWIIRKINLIRWWKKHALVWDTVDFPASKLPMGRLRSSWESPTVCENLEAWVTDGALRSSSERGSRSRYDIILLSARSAHHYSSPLTRATRQAHFWLDLPNK